VESIKHGLILDKDYFAFLEKNINKILEKDAVLLEEIAYQNVKLKGNVVEIDPNEKNYRRALNFGHTLGHAVEIVSNFQLYHGEAVQLGLLSALHISQVQNGLSAEEFDRAKELLINGLSLLSKVPSYIDRDEVEKRLANDKKAVDGVPYFVTINNIGELHTNAEEQYAAPISKEMLKAAMDYIWKNT